MDTQWSFNALTGLSCYADFIPCVAFGKFQCPHGLELLLVPPDISISIRCFNALTGLSCYCWYRYTFIQSICFNALTGLSCYQKSTRGVRTDSGFNALTGLSCYSKLLVRLYDFPSFNALTGLSCYGKNVQYFKFFMILFYTYLLFIGVY